IETLLREHPEVHWDRLLFSAKESVYKAWFPLTSRWLAFEDADVTFDPVAHTFEAQLMVPGPCLHGRELIGFSGRFLATRGLVLTAIAIIAPAQATRSDPTRPRYTTAQTGSDDFGSGSCGTLTEHPGQLGLLDGHARQQCQRSNAGADQQGQPVASADA